MRFARLDGSLRARSQRSLEELERSAVYPLGSDRFRISHGSDYFAFFDRLGELHYHAVLDGERVATVGAGVLRAVPLSEGGPLRRAWYLCDLKTHPDYRGRKLPLKLLSSAFLLNYLRCPRGYAISMNPDGRQENRIVRMMKHFRWAPARLAALLELYSFDHDQMLAHEPLLRRHRGDVSYLSLEGKKDIILESTGKPLKLLHAQFGPCAEPGLATPQPGHTHMFCAPSEDPLACAMRARGARPSATASLIAHRMSACDWRFVLTSDI